MNKNRRKRLSSVIGSLEGLSEELPRNEIESTLSSSQSEVELIADEEQEAADALPENLMSSQMYEDMTENATDLYDASAELDSALSEFHDEGAEYGDVEDDVGSAVSLIQGVIDR